MKKLFTLAVVAGAAYYFVKKQMEVNSRKTEEDLEEKVEKLEDTVSQIEESVKTEEDLDALIQKTEELVNQVEEELKEESEEIDPEFSLDEKQEEESLEENNESVIAEEAEPSTEEVLTEVAETVTEAVTDVVDAVSKFGETLFESVTEKANKTAERLLNLQVDLVMANYPDDHIFLLQHSVEYRDKEKLAELMNDYRAMGYIIGSNGHYVQFEKVILQKDDQIKNEILNLARRVRLEGEIYKGFNIIPQ